MDTSYYTTKDKGQYKMSDREQNNGGFNYTVGDYDNVHGKLNNTGMEGDYDNAPGKPNYEHTSDFQNGNQNSNGNLLPAYCLSENDYKQQVVTGHRTKVRISQDLEDNSDDFLFPGQKNAYFNSSQQSLQRTDKEDQLIIGRSDPSYFDNSVSSDVRRRHEHESVGNTSSMTDQQFRQSSVDTMGTVFYSPPPDLAKSKAPVASQVNQNIGGSATNASSHQQSFQYGFNDGDYDNAPPLPVRMQGDDEVDLSVASRRGRRENDASRASFYSNGSSTQGYNSLTQQNNSGQKDRLESVKEHKQNLSQQPARSLVNSAQTVPTNHSESTKFHGAQVTQPLPPEFELIRNKCLSSRRLFIDPDFPPDDTSLYSGRQRPSYASGIKWMRPPEIVANSGYSPKFVDGFSIDDIVQGGLGDCYLLASFACLAATKYERSVVLPHVVPEHQSFDPEWYAGVFCFRFWKMGFWQVVIVDDLLPTINGRLIYLSSNQQNEFWGALVEKAYAKFKGSYAALDGGYISNAMEDITGGLAESYDFREGHTKEFPSPSELQIIFKADSHQHSLMGGAIDSRPPEEVIATDPTGQILRTGLIGGHAYSILEVKEFKYIRPHPDGSKSMTLIRVRNPWGKTEWNGAWSDNSPLWKNIVSSEEGFNVISDDGSFWISPEDYRASFSAVVICHLAPPLTMCWGVSVYQGKWVVGKSAGGPHTNLKSFCTNPQFVLIISKADEIMPIIVGLMQSDNTLSSGLAYCGIGFLIYPLKPEQNPPMDHNFFARTRAAYQIDTFFQNRSVTRRITLTAGRFVIVPCTFNRNEESEFLLRVFHYDDRDGNDLKIYKIDPNGILVDESLRDSRCGTVRKNRKLPGITEDDKKQLFDNRIQTQPKPKKNRSINRISCCTSDWRE